MKTKIRFIVPILFFAHACNPNSDEKNLDFHKLTMPKDSTSLYFNTKQETSKSKQDALSHFVNTWFSEMLFALKEPIISDYKGGKEVYRLTWIRSFHHPVSIRLEKWKNEIKMVTKVCDGAGGYEPGDLIQDTTFSISTEKYDTLIDIIEQANFWKLHTEKSNENGMDGSEWIIEAYKNGNYHMVFRWTPRKGQFEKFKAIGDHLISISEIKKEELIYYY